MGPTARHLFGHDVAMPERPLSVTLDVELILARKA
jgi:hypothetical protein